MHFSRLMFRCPSLLALLLLFGLGSSGCEKLEQHKAYKTRQFDCDNKTITVDVDNGVDKHHQAIYVCGGETVKWDAPPTVTSFTVHFDPGNCPFNPCPDISDSAPRTVSKQPYDLTVYKYTITVNNGPPHDPHVVGGGGS
jgi:hypothetical protein